MSSRLSQVREQRQANSRAIHDLLDRTKNKPWGGAEQSVYDAHFAVIERCDVEAAALERKREGLADARVQDAIDTAYRERRAPRDELTDKFLRKGTAGFSDDEKIAIRATLSTTTGGQGGFTVPTLVSDRFADLLKNYSGVRRVAEVIRTETGGPFGFPISDGSAEVGERLPENQAASALDPSFATASLQTWKYGSKIFTVPYELLQDSMLDIEQYILRRAAARIGRLSNTDFTVGTGSSQPQGFTGAAGLGKTGTTGQTATVIHDDLIDLVGSVNTSYRQVPLGLCFQMSDVAFKVCRKLKDTQGRPLYLPDEGQSSESILGYDVIVNDDIAVPAASAKSIFFGNFNLCYKIRDAMDVTLFRFEDSAYATKGQVGFMAVARMGGNVVDSAGLKYYANSAS